MSGQADVIGELNLFQQMVHALHRAERETCGRGRKSPLRNLSIAACIYVISPGQLSFRLIGALRRYVIASFNTLD